MAAKTVAISALECRLKEAEIRKALAEADVAELEAKEKRREDRDHEASANQAKVYPFFGAVTGGTVQPCIATLGSWSRREPGADLTIVFNSPGGAVIDGLALYDFLSQLKSEGHKIKTVARGMAASMGGVLLQAGDERVIGANAHILVHEITTGMIGKFSEIEDEVLFCKMLQERILSILARRSTLTEKQIRSRWNRRDWWISATSAVEIGLADSIG
jgi:ATP-dependent Clp endopeptidase proteolytic subunit ClpP